MEKVLFPFGRWEIGTHQGQATGWGSQSERSLSDPKVHAVTLSAFQVLSGATAYKNDRDPTLAIRVQASGAEISND